MGKTIRAQPKKLVTPPSPETNTYINSTPSSIPSHLDHLFSPDSKRFQSPPSSEKPTNGLPRHRKYRPNAEVFHGHDLCQKKCIEVQEELGFPAGVLRLEDIIEVGYNRQAGFIWILQKKKTEHKFRKIGTTVSYDTEITAFVEKQRMKKITGIKSKEFLLWVAISDMYINDPASGKINFKTYTALERTLPVSAFVLEDEQEEEKKKKEGVAQGKK